MFNILQNIFFRDYLTILKIKNVIRYFNVT